MYICTCVCLHVCVCVGAHARCVYKSEVNHRCFSSDAICLGFKHILTVLELANVIMEGQKCTWLCLPALELQSSVVAPCFSRCFLGRNCRFLSSCFRGKHCAGESGSSPLMELSWKGKPFSLLSGSHYMSSILLLVVSAFMGCLNTCMHALMHTCTPTEQTTDKTNQPSAITFETMNQNKTFLLKLNFPSIFVTRTES